MKRINYLSLFSGIAGFEVGILQAGIKFNWHGFSEIDRYAIKVYKEHFPDAKELGTITAIDGRKLPKLNLVTFGFPCQDLSLAGKRRGLDGHRSGLFFEAIRIIDENKPDYFIFENVKGIFSSNSGKDFDIILRTIADIGYDGQWQLLNTAWFLPQNRERIYFVGYPRNKPRPQVFPITENSREITTIQGQGINTNTLTARYYGGQATGSYIIERQQLPQTKGASQGYRVYDTAGISQTLCGQSGGLGAKTGLYCVAQRGRGEDNKQTLEVRPDNNTNSLTSVQKDNLIVGQGIRRLTPVECARLQGFPDDWCKSWFDEINFMGLITKDFLRGNVCENYAQLKTAKDKLLIENLDFASCTIKDLDGTDLQISIREDLESNKNAQSVVGMCCLMDQEDFVQNIINLGKYTVTLYDKTQILNLDTTISGDTIQRMVERLTYPLLKIELVEKYSKAKLSIILTWIRKIINRKIFICAKTGQNITSVIIRWNCSRKNYCTEKLFILKMGNINYVSDSQQYRCYGNAVSVPVVKAIIERLYEPTRNEIQE